ncbi:MAG: lysophospholipid acyltransferase family protein [Planctomycetes bacterium]|nr:lysophospholipid acyltransferase family protein [Planctomycetota bacterium]
MAAPAFDLLATAVPAVAPHVVRGLMSTCSFRILGSGVKDRIIDGDGGFVGVVWHKDFLFALDFFRRRKIVVMVSRSKDGELVARALHRLGYRTVRGSSSAGGREALGELTDLVRSGWGSAIIADGPRGPAKQAKIGCVLAGRNSGAPLIPWGCHAEPNLSLRNWDRTMIPKPFARITVAFGDPIRVPAGATREECEALRDLVDLKMADLEKDCRS